MPSKLELNRELQDWRTRACAAEARLTEAERKNKLLNARLARRRRGFWGRLWVRVRALLRGK